MGRIFTLDTNGNWQVVATPATTKVGNNRAYWIFCDGTSGFMGPVAVDFDGAGKGVLDFGGPEDAVAVDGSTVSFDLEELVLTNLDASAVVPSLVRHSVQRAGHLPQDPPLATQNELVLNKITPVPGSFKFSDGGVLPTALASSTTLPSVAAGESGTTTFGADARRQFSQVAGRTRTQLFRLKTGGGNEFWLPLRARSTTALSPTPTAPQASGAGLWVGEVIYDSATSIVEDGSPSKPAAGSAPMRLIVHSNGSDTVKLLNQVTIMQTRSADPALAPEPKLVVDPRQIPFFEGIKRRDGKLVGLRVQTVGYDMPRDVTPATQAALVASTAAQVPPVDTSSEQKLLDYLAARSARPPKLEEKYSLSLALEGDLGASLILRTTADAPLRLDPFHRSNPFRHAFHQMHGAGANIERSLSMVFDAEQPVAERLSGTFSETITGLIKQDLVLSGRVELQRVSSVTSLEE